MAESVILEETIYEGFSGGNFAVSPAPIVLTEGETYRVVWDGVEHECVCALLDGFPTVTDADDLAAPTEASFLIQYASAEMAEADADILVLSAIDLTSDTMMDTVNTSHTVAIYQVVEEESGDSGTEEPENPEESYDANDVSVKSYSQENVIFRDVPKIWLKKAGSSDEEPVLVPFTFGEATEDVPITGLDFSGGNHCFEAPSGVLVKSAVVEKPEDLVPEKIAEGEYIAGVGPGTFAGGGGDVVDWTDPNLQFFSYQIDPVNKQIILFSVLYQNIYEATGSYDVHVPNQIGGLDVIIACI